MCRGNQQENSNGLKDPLAVDTKTVEIKQKKEEIESVRKTLLTNILADVIKVT